MDTNINETMASEAVANVTVNEATNAKVKAETKVALNLGELLVEKVPDVMSKFAYRKSDEGMIRNQCEALMRTIIAINEKDEFARHLRVEGDSYAFTEYELWNGFKSFIVPRKVAVTVSDDAIDLIDRNQYHVKGKLLNPSEFARTQNEMLRRMVRFAWTVDHPVDRGDEVLADSVAKGVVYQGRYVLDAKQDRLIPLKVPVYYKEAFKVKLDRWLDEWISAAVEVK